MDPKLTKWGVPVLATAAVATFGYFLYRRQKNKNEEKKKPTRRHVKPMEAKIRFFRGEPHIRSPLEEKSGKKTDMSDTLPFKGLLTFPENIEAACRKFSSKVLYRFRKVDREYVERDLKSGDDLVTYKSGPVHEVSYTKYLSMVQAAASGIFHHVQILAGEFEREKMKIGISANTSFDWILAFHGCTFNNFPIVTMYPDLGKDAIVKIVNDCELRMVFVSAQDLSLFMAIKEKCKTLQKLIVFGKIPKSFDMSKARDVEIVNFYDMLMDGRRHPTKRPAAPKKDDVLFYIYTSGTTGAPKGVIHTHSNIVNGCGGMNAQILVRKDDVHLSYLPFAHIFEQMLHHMAFFNGATICFGNPRTLVCKKGGAMDVGDLELFAPTFFIGVPRVFDTILKAVTTKVKIAGGVKEKLFNWVLKKKMDRIEKNSDNSPVMFESLVFGKVRKLFGGRVRFLVSGAAPLSGSTMRFLQAALGEKTTVGQLYGLSETGACIQHCNWGNLRPIYCVGAEVKLIDVPEMGYFAKNLEGEICFHSPDVTCKGYFKLDEQYKNAFTEDGYFKTGDIGRINNPEGTLSVIDRRKNLAKLPNGEYVSLEQLEMIYSQSPFIIANGLCIFVDSLKDHIVAVGLIDPAYVKYWVKTHGLMITNLKQFANHPKLKRAVTKSFSELAKKNNLVGYKILRHFVLFKDTWGPHNDLTTSTMKKKRKKLKEFYEKEIEKMYLKGSEVPVDSLVNVGKSRKPAVDSLYEQFKY